jgi:hypothetical protein
MWLKTLFQPADTPKEVRLAESMDDASLSLLAPFLGVHAEWKLQEDALSAQERKEQGEYIQSKLHSLNQQFPLLQAALVLEGTTKLDHFFP